MEKDAEFLNRLMATFKTEAQEHLRSLSSGFIELEKAQPEEQGGIIETVFREAHSLKGAARSVNLPDVVHVCQSMESVLAALKRKEIAPSPPLLDLLHQSVSMAGRLVAGEELSEADKTGRKDLVRKLETAAAGAKLEAGEAEKVVKEMPSEHEEVEGPPPVLPMPAHASLVSAPSLGETIRISTAKLDSLLLQSEELLSVKLATGQRATELKEITKAIDAWKKERAKAGKKEPGEKGQVALKAGARKPDTSYLAPTSTTEQFIFSIESRLTALLKAAEYDHRSFGMMVDNLLDYMKKSLMLPISSLTEMFPGFVRDLARDAGKQVEFVSSGGEIEIDRRILEELKDPIIHLVRNCIDHGIEIPEERLRKNKPSQGKVEISVLSRDNKIEIVVSDDGAGMDASRIRSSAVKLGLMSQDEAIRLDEQEALRLVFRSGVTTSPIITDISGRGLGLAIVQEKVEKLNGAVTVESRHDEGTSFSLVAPLTLATFRGTLVRVGEHIYVLPSINVERVARVKKEEIRTVENRETLSFNGQAISLSRLKEVLELGAGGARPQATDPYIQIAVLSAAEKRMAFQVDEVMQEQEVLVKPLGRQLSRVRNVAGATVFGSGKVVPILNVADLMKSAVKIAGAPAVRSVEELAERERKSVLVVEDSITTRILLKNILESAGYDVRTAVDGLDALATLKTIEFDLVVSDVDMPRMNGFDLTARIRSDKKLSELPVILVTALESREDRERGIDAGANAYIVKSSFDQSNLLEVIKRLV